MTLFSGHEQGPEAYLRWERNMEDWFQSQQILEKDKPSYAEETLTGEAFNNWEVEDAIQINYDGPAYTWGDMKTIMYQEFVENAPAQHPLYSKSVVSHAKTNWLFAANPSPKTMPKHVYSSKNMSTRTLVKPQAVQPKCSR